MRQQLVRPHIGSEHFEAFAELLKHEADFPRTHAEWSDRVSTEHQGHLLLRRVTRDVIALPDEFRRFCRELAQMPSVALLEAFAVYAARSAELSTRPAAALGLMI